MADQRITQLTALAKGDVAATDVLPIVDIGSSQTKKVTAKDLVAAGIDLVDNGEIDLAKLDQSSATKLGTVALADDAVTAAKLADDSSVAYESVAPASNNFQGRGYVNSTSQYLQVWNGTAFVQVVAPTAGIEDLAVTTGKLAANAVTTAKVDASGLGAAAIATDAVTTAKIQNSAVTTDKLNNLAVTTAKIAADAVTAAELANNAVDTAAIVDGAVTVNKLATDAVSTIKVQDGAITNDKIANTTIAYGKLNLADASVPGAKLAANSVTSGQLANDAVTTGAITDLNITTGKLADGAVTEAKLGALSVTTAKIAADAVTATELANDAVDTTAIVNAAVTEAKLAATAVSEAKLADGAVTVNKIADTQVTYAKLNLADGSVPGAKITDASVTSAKLAADAVTTSQILNDAVTEAKIADDAVTAAQLATGSVTADAIAADAVTTAEILNSAVTYAKVQNVSATDRILGRSTAGAGVVEEIICTSAARALLDDADATEQRATLGLGTLATQDGTVSGTHSGTSSGNNTGDQTITLTGAVTGTGTGTFATAIATSAVTETTIATNAVTTGKILDGAITGLKLAADSSTVVAGNAPVGSGEFEGQQWFNSNSGLAYVWTGAAWQQLSALQTVSFADTTPLTFTVTKPDNFSTVVTTTLDTQAAASVFAGPASGANAAPTFRALAPEDLPIAAVASNGAVQPGTGLSVSGTGVINHINTVTPGVYTKVTVDSEGHVDIGELLLAADVPALDAAKITTGTFGTAFLATDSVTDLQLADYSTASLGEAFPVANFIGQLHLNPLERSFYMWDGNVYVPIGISAGQIILAGTFDASSPAGVGQVESVTPDGAAAGFVVGDALPVSTLTNNKYYFVVSQGGTITSGNAPNVTLAPPDIILSVFSETNPQFVEIDVSAGAGAIAASNVSFNPVGEVGSTNVQAAIAEVSSECRNATNITSGTLAVARGGTGIVTYTKGELLAASAATTLTALTVGANGTVLRANSATATGLEWSADFVGTVTTVTSSTGALTVATATTTPALTIRSATTSVNGIVQLSDSTSTTSSVLAATPTAVKSAFDLANAALPKAGGVITGALEIGVTGSLVFEGSTNDGFETTLTVADPTVDRTITLPNLTGTVALTSQLDDGTY